MRGDQRPHHRMGAGQTCQRADAQQKRHCQSADAVSADAAVAHDVEFLFARMAAAETVGGIGEAVFMQAAGRQHRGGHAECRRRPWRQPQAMDNALDDRAAEAARDSELRASGVAGSSGKRVQNTMPALSSSARFSSQLSEIVISRRPCYRCSALSCARNCIGMTNFTSFSDLRAACLDLPSGHPAASAAVAQREATLTKPPKSLGRLEDLVAWLAHWQGHAPRLDSVEILVFAGNHGVSKQGGSGYP